MCAIKKDWVHFSIMYSEYIVEAFDFVGTKLFIINYQNFVDK